MNFIPIAWGKNPPPRPKYHHVIGEIPSGLNAGPSEVTYEGTDKMYVSFCGGSWLWADLGACTHRNSKVQDALTVIGARAPRDWHLEQYCKPKDMFEKQLKGLTLALRSHRQITHTSREESLLPLKMLQGIKHGTKRLTALTSGRSTP